MIKSITQQLEELTGGKWRAVRNGFGWEYHGPDGIVVRRYLESILDWDGYSDTKFAVVYYDNKGRRLPVVSKKMMVELL